MSSGSVVDLTSEGFLVKAKEGGDFVVLLSANWSGPCRLAHSILSEVSKVFFDLVEGKGVSQITSNVVGGQSKLSHKKLRGLGFYRINIDSAAEVASLYGVKAIPSILMVRNGEIIGTINGVLSEKSLEKRIKEGFGY